MDAENGEFRTPKPYWGPFPGESPELYEHLGVWKIYKAIKPHFPRQLIGDFSMEHGRSLGVGIHKEHTPPEELTKQDRLERYVDWTKTNEKAHIIGFFVMTGCTAAILRDQDTTSFVVAGAASAANIATNVYPVLLQRYNRLKAYRVLEKLTSKNR